MVQMNTLLLPLLAIALPALADGAPMVVHADAVLATLSPWMVGAGIEDVNHEVRAVLLLVCSWCCSWCSS